MGATDPRKPTRTLSAEERRILQSIATEDRAWTGREPDWPAVVRLIGLGDLIVRPNTRDGIHHVDLTPTARAALTVDDILEKMRAEPSPGMVREVAKVVRAWRAGLSDDARDLLSAHDLAALSSAIAFAMVNEEIVREVKP